MGGGTATGTGGRWPSGPLEVMLDLDCGHQVVSKSAAKIGDDYNCEKCIETVKITNLRLRQVQLKDKLRRKFITGPKKKLEAKQMERKFREIQRKAMNG